MSRIAEAYVEITAKTEKMNRSLDAVRAKNNQAAADFEKRWSRAGDKMMGVGRKMMLGITLPLVAIGAVALKAYSEAEDAINALNSALKLTGSYSDATSAKLRAYADQVMKLTVYDDEAIVNEMAYAHNLGVTADKLEEATKAAAGLAAKYKIDLHTATMLIGRASQGATQMLRRYGIVLDDSLSPQEKFNKLLEIGAGAFGLAEAQAKTTSGRIQQLRNRVGELAEDLGRKLMPLLEKLLGQLIKLADWWERQSPPMQDFYVKLGLIAAIAGPVVYGLGAIGKAIAWIAGLASTAIGTVGGLATALAGIAAVLAGGALGELSNIVRGRNEPGKWWEHTAAGAAYGAVKERRRGAGVARGAQEMQQELLARNQPTYQNTAAALGFRKEWEAGTLTTEQKTQLRAEQERRRAEWLRRVRAAKAAAARPGAGAAGAGEAEDTEAALLIDYEMRKRHADKVTALQLEMGQKLKEAREREPEPAGPKELAYIERNYLDLITTAQKEAAQERKDAVKKNLADELAARREYATSWLALAGRAYDAERQAAINAYNQEMERLDELAAKGEDVAWRRWSAYAEAAKNITNINKQEADERKTQIEEEKRQQQELMEKQRAAAETLLSFTQDRIARILGMTRGEYSENKRRREDELQAEKKRIDELAATDEQKRTLKRAAELVAAKDLLGFQDAEYKKGEELLEQDRARKREKVGWTSLAELYRSAAVAGARAGLMTPPTVPKQLDTQALVDLAKLLPELQKQTGIEQQQLGKLDNAFGYGSP